MSNINSKKALNAPYGFTAVDNRLFYMQEHISPNAFSILFRIYRMSNGYDGLPKSLSNTYFQKTCNISKNTVTKAVKELESLGIVVAQRRSRSNTLYSISMSKVNDLFLSTLNESQEVTSTVIDDSHNMNTCGTEYVHTASQDVCSNKENLIKQNTNKENIINISFDTFWTMYDYKKGKPSDVETKWLALDDSERVAIIATLPSYISSTPDKTFRKFPMSYLNTEAWNDEIVIADTSVNTTVNSDSTNTTSNVSSVSGVTDVINQHRNKGNCNTLNTTNTTNTANTGNSNYNSSSNNYNSNNDCYSASFQDFSDEVITDSDTPHWWDIKNSNSSSNSGNSNNSSTVSKDAPKRLSTDISKSVDDFLANFGSKGNTYGK